MSNDRRIAQVYAKLTVEERVVAIVRALHAGRNPDPRLRSTMPDAQARAYNHYAARLDALDSMGRAWVAVMDRTLAEIDARLGWLTTLRVIEGCLEPLHYALETTTAGRQGAPLRQAAAEALAHLDRVLGDGGGDEARADPPIAEILGAGLRDSIAGQWSELRALEHEVDTLAADLGGTDPLPPDLRALVTAHTTRLMELAKEPFLGGSVPLPEPDEALQERAAKLLNDR